MKRVFRKAKRTAKEVKSKGEDYVEAKRVENEPPKTVPKITNTAIPEHREEVLSSARKFIYPLQHSKHKIVMITTAIVIAALLAFFTYATVSLYRLGNNSNFIYKVTQIVPFPIARVGGGFVAYENYLFELRRYMHYYETQQKLDFNSESGQQQLEEFERRALDRVITLSYVKKLAKEKKITVSNQEVDEQVQLLKDQNRLGNGDQVFEDVLQDYFGWTVADFKRYLSQEILTQKVVAAMDTETQDKANAAYAELQAGTPFEQVAAKYSDDQASKANGGDYGFTITKTSRDITPQATDTLFGLEPGQYSAVINTGYSLEIFKLLEKKGDTVRGAHILFNFKDISTYTNDMKEKQPARVYIPMTPAPAQ
jgi:hypothetical protein